MLEELQRIRKLLEKPENWCKVQAATDIDGNEVEPNDPRSIVFCLYGAVCKENASIITDLLLTRAAHDMGYHGYIHFNEHPDTKHQDILELLDTAIASC